MAGQPKTRRRKELKEAEESRPVVAELAAPTMDEKTGESKVNGVSIDALLEGFPDAEEALTGVSPALPDQIPPDIQVPKGRQSRGKEEERMLEAMVPSASGVMFHQQTNSGPVFRRYVPYQEMSAYTSTEVFISEVLAKQYGGGRWFMTIVLSDGKQKRAGNVLLDEKQYAPIQEDAGMDQDLKAMLMGLVDVGRRQSTELDELRKAISGAQQKEPPKSALDKLLEMTMMERVMEKFDSGGPKRSIEDVIDRRLREMEERIAKRDRETGGGSGGVSFGAVPPMPAPPTNQFADAMPMLKEVLGIFQSMTAKLAEQQASSSKPIDNSGPYKEMLAMQNEMANKIQELQQKMTDDRIGQLHGHIAELREDIKEATQNPQNQLDVTLDTFHKVREFQESVGLNGAQKTGDLMSFLKDVVKTLPVLMDKMGPQIRIPVQAPAPAQAQVQAPAQIQAPETQAEPEAQERKPERETGSFNVTDFIASLKEVESDEEVGKRLSEMLKSLYRHPDTGPQLKAFGFPETLPDIAEHYLNDAVAKKLLTVREAARIMGIVTSGKVGTAWASENLASSPPASEQSSDSSTK